MARKNRRPNIKISFANIREDIKVLISDISRIDIKKVKESSNIRDDLGVDSLSAMEILALIEKRLGIEIDEAKVFNVVTVKDLMDLVMWYVNKRPRRRRVRLRQKK